MRLFLDTSGPVCKVWLDEAYFEWSADRQLAKGLLKFLQECLAKQKAGFDDLTGLGFMLGPGSFTGLRIGATVLNTIADANQLPIVGATGDSWLKTARQKLSAGKDEKLVLPAYGAKPNVTIFKATP